MVTRRKWRHLPMLAAVWVTATAGTSVAAEQAIIVLDGSGSMWGQIDGTPKIAIARDVLGRVLDQSPRDLRLGLLAYGHRKKGDCGDIELLIAPAPGAGPEIHGMARDLKPKGKTPLSDAIRQAAEALKYTEQKATVILITDGLETCSADPCAVARELEAAGVNFTAHVIGFGLSPEEGAQVACVADETGGAYFQAIDANGLGDALAASVAEVSLPSPPAETPQGQDDGPLPAASLQAPDEVLIGSTFTVDWQGPGEPHDHIFLFAPAAGEGSGRAVRGRRLASSPDFAARKLSLVAPGEPGAYELQYQYGPLRRVIATRPVTVVPTNVSLSAPATVGIGATFTVDWIGPGGERDHVVLYEAAAGVAGKAVAAKRLSNDDPSNRKVSLVAPTEPGFYLLAYLEGEDRKVLALRQIEILPVAVMLAAPDAVDMGSTFDVVWTGPGANRDTVELFDPAAGSAGKVIAAARLANGDYANRTVSLVAPSVPGDYLLRYKNGDSLEVLATRPLAIAPVAVSLDAPASVLAGSNLVVAWSGPGGNRDQIEIFDPATGKVMAAKRLVNDDFKGRKATIKVPKQPGAYRLRYNSIQDGLILVERELAVE